MKAGNVILRISRVLPGNVEGSRRETRRDLCPIYCVIRHRYVGPAERIVHSPGVTNILTSTCTTPY